jgi:hypothetical protein
VLFKICKFRRTPTIIDGCFRYVLKYIWLKVLSLEQRNWQRIKEKTKYRANAMAKLYLYQGRYRYSKGKESVISLLKVMNNE